MIVKTLSINEKSKYRIKSLVKYVLDDGQERTNHYESFVILNNIYTLDRTKIHKEFLANDTFRKKRKNGVCYFHEILSISPKDAAHVTDDMLEDLTLKYIEIRGAKQALVLAKRHIEKSHRHVHLLISATGYKSHKSLRLDNENFRRVRLEIEAYQQKVYPELEFSIAYLNKERKRANKKQADKNSRFQKEYQMKLRLDNKKPTKKEILQQRVSKILEASSYPKEFLNLLEKEPDFTLYQTRGKITGIIFEKRKFRFTTIGIPKKDLQKLQEQHLKLKILEKKSLEQTQLFDRDFKGR